jgi:hypothetical protein
VKRDATPATAVVVDDNNEPFTSVLPLDVEALPCSFPALPAKNRIDHPAGQLLVCVANASGTIHENNNEMQASEGVARDTPGDGESEQHNQPGIGQEYELSSF